VVLDAEAVVEAQFIAGRQLAPELFVAGRRTHPRFIPDVGEMGELHIRCKLTSMAVGKFVPASSAFLVEAVDVAALVQFSHEARVEVILRIV